MTQRKASPSKLPAAVGDGGCPSSLGEFAHPYNPSNPMALIGRACHEAIACHVSGVEPDLESIARAHSVEHGEVVWRFVWARKAWRQLCNDDELGPLIAAGTVEVEVRVESPVTFGTADVLVVVRNGDQVTALIVIDWKFGQRQDHHRPQIMSYVDGARHEYGMPESGVVYGVEVWVAHEDIELNGYTVHELDALRVQVAQAMKRAGKDYVPGRACRYCVGRLSCQAKTDYDRSAVEALVPLSGTRYPVPSDEVFVELLPRVQAVELAVRRFYAMLGSRLDGGDLRLNDEKILRKIPTTKVTVEPLKAWPVLERELTEDEMSGVISISTGDLKKAIMNKSPRGQKGKIRDAVMAELADVGAVTETTSMMRRELKRTVEDVEKELADAVAAEKELAEGERARMLEEYAGISDG